MGSGRISLRSVLMASVALTIFGMPAEIASAALDEIVITAAHREQSLQDVPIAVTAIDSVELDRLNAISYADLSGYLPNFSFNSLTNVGFVVPVIRGVGLTGSGESAISNNPTTGFYIDGVYIRAAGGNLFNVVDVERVEILRGPQGTLYGRNTLGGVINIITKKPGDELDFSARASYGNFNRKDFRASLSGPLVADKLLGRFGVAYIDRDGRVDNNFSTPDARFNESGADVDDLDSLTLRGAAIYKATPNLEFTFAGDYSKDNTTYPGYNVEDGSLDLSAFFLSGTYADTDGDVHEVSYNSNNEEMARNWGASLTGEWSSGNYRVVSITGYRNTIFENDNSDIDGTPFNIFQQFLRLEEEAVSQELRLHYEDDRLDTVAGVYYYGYQGQQDSTLDIFGIERELGYPLSVFGAPVLSTGISRAVVNTETDTFSAFGHAGYRILPDLRIEAGLRYTTTDVEFQRPVSRSEIGGLSNPFYDGSNPFDEVPAGVALTSNGGEIPLVEDTFSKVTPKVGISYDVNEETLVYATWSKGFREGGFATRPSSGNGAFDAENLTAYEVGAKSDLFDRRLRLNLAAYWYRYKDQQAEETSLGGPGFFVDITNSGRSRARGVELEFVTNPVDFFSLQGSFGWQETKFLELDTGLGGNLAGNEFPRAPKYSAALIPTFYYNVPNAGTLSLRGEWTYQSDEFDGLTNDRNLVLERRNVFGASMSFESIDQDWSLTLWGKNLTDEEYAIRVVDLSGFFGYRLRSYGAPREFGFTATYSYN